MTIHLATIIENGKCVAALGDGQTLWPMLKLAKAAGLDDFPKDLIGLFERWADLRPTIDRLMSTAVNESGVVGIPIAQAILAAPLQFPGKILCAGANYYDHIAEMGITDLSKEGQRLFFFLKPPRNCVVGPGRTACIPERSSEYDWEVELAIVFGRTVKNATLENALDSIAAVTVSIDLSARDHVFAPDTFYKMDWVAGKANDTSCPMGPWLVPADQFDDLQNLNLKLSVNDEVKQDGNTSGMIFSIAEQIVLASSIMTLDPGDVLLTGTPAGVGRPKGTYLNSGDRICAEIENIGELNVEMFS